LYQRPKGVTNLARTDQDDDEAVDCFAKGTTKKGLGYLQEDQKTDHTIRYFQYTSILSAAEFHIFRLLRNFL
jgi:hypothetical protein